MSKADVPIVDEPPDDDVAIGESPDGTRLSGDQARQLLTNRRNVLVALGTLGSIAAIASGDLDSNAGDGGSIYGGTMALDKAYKIGPRTYLGPDSAKSGVLSSIPDDEGWIYQAADTDVDYYLDAGSWNLRNIGSTAKKVDVTAGELTADEVVKNNFTWGNPNPNDPRSFEDDFGDGSISNFIHPVPSSSVSESGGTLSISSSGSGNWTDGIRSAYRYQDYVMYEVVLEITNSPNASDSALVQMWQNQNWDELNITDTTGPAGGLYVALDTDGGVEFQDVDESASFGSGISMASSQITTNTKYTVRMVYDRENNTAGAVVSGNGSTNVARKSGLTDFQDGLAVGIGDFNEPDIDVHSIKVQADSTPTRFIVPDQITEAIRQEQATDPPSTPYQPKEVMGVMVDGTTYVVCTGMDAYAGSQTQLNVTLWKSDNPFQGYEQVSKVTEGGTNNKFAPAIYYDGSDLWLFISDNSSGDVIGKRSSIDSIPSSPAGWTDEGTVVGSANDLKTVLVKDGNLHLAFNDNQLSSTVIGMVDGSDPNNLSNRRTIVPTGQTKIFTGEVPHIIPDGDGGYLMFGSGLNKQSTDSGNRGTVVLKSDSIDGTYKEGPTSVVNQAGLFVDTDVSWASDWLSHLTFVMNESHTGPATWRGNHIALFEAGDGSEFRVGAAACPKFDTEEIGQLIDNAVTV